MATKLEKIINEYIYDAMKQVDKDLDKAIKITNNELYDESINMYKKYIHDYYLYKTKSYIRHWEGVPGTREGQNLYFGMDIRKKGGEKPSLSIYMPYDEHYKASDKMADDYQHDSAKDVLANVVYGNRGIPNIWEKEWYGDYDGKYFSYKGKMSNAFDTFNNRFDDIAKDIIKLNLKKMGY